MNFEQVSEKISASGYRRRTAPSVIENESGDGIIKIYDFEHRKKQDMFSVYLNEFDSVEYIEFTRVNFNRETREYSQQVIRIDNIKELNKYLG